VLDANPQIADLLKPVFEALTLEELQALNGRVQVGGEAAAAVAADWLKSKGFVS
jgi:osmoprotectant transport system substrate-binding protein